MDTNTSAINSILSQRDAIKVVDAADTGFNGLDSQDFLKLLISQLQNQDPTNPMDSDQLLAQISDMRNLQANLELETTLKGLTLNQSLTGASALLGKTVTALASDQSEFTGTVDRVVIRDGKTLLQIGDRQVELSAVQSVDAE